MKNILMLLVLANVLYFLWGKFVSTPEEAGVVVVNEADLGPPLDISRSAAALAATNINAALEAGRLTDLAAVVGRSCVSVGPFTSSADANDALSEYVNEGMRASVRTTDGQVFVGHWVQIRNIPDRSAGNEMLSTLRDGGLGDAYLVETEDEGLKISLGLFGEMSRAERIELQAKSLDLPADISQRMRDTTVFFVDIGLPPGRGAGTMMEKHGEGKVRLRDQATCPRSD